MRYRKDGKQVVEVWRFQAGFDGGRTLQRYPDCGSLLRNLRLSFNADFDKYRLLERVEP